MVHIYAGNLLMTTGSYEDATKAFTNADNIHKSPLALYQRSRCHVALNSMNEALKDLNKVIESSPNDKVAIADRECLTALKLAQTGFGGGLPAPVGAPSATLASVPSQIGNVQPAVQQAPFEKQVYEKGIVILTKLISYEKNLHLAKINHDSSVLYQHSQIIPSAGRTKTDKVRAIRRRRE
jgi:tetratricopeptide (TPR) repeat protein